VAAAPPAAAPPPSVATTASIPPAAPGAAPQGALTPLPQVTVNAPPAPGPTDQPPRGLVGNVFSGISTIAGGAANVTGNTVNWVIDLPGKAISAGGRLLGGGSPPAAAPVPAAAPASVPAATPAPAPALDPQRRNYL
jgi:pyruvate dehydrogenase E2 component (dihydrolipoamide acetyltransferase)